MPEIINDKTERRKNDNEMIRFLRNLKSLVKSLNGVCFISCDESLLTPFLINNIIYLSDLSLKITSFKDYIEMEIGEYDGTLKLLKQPKIHGLISSIGDFDIYGLKLKGKSSIVIEKIHLEPEESRAGQDANLNQGSSKVGISSVMCNQTKSH